MGLAESALGNCCSQDERKNSYKAYMTNLRMTGVDGLGDLETTESGIDYKNSFELAANLKLTRDGIVKLYDDLMRTFAKVQS